MGGHPPLKAQPLKAQPLFPWRGHPCPRREQLGGQECPPSKAILSDHSYGQTPELLMMRGIVEAFPAEPSPTPL